MKHKSLFLAAALAVPVLFIFILAAEALAEGAVRVSTDSAGNQVYASNAYTTISESGRYVAFHSPAATLVPGDNNGVNDIFVKDLNTGAITRVSTAAGGVQANGASTAPVLSADGQFVAFHSAATNLVAGDTNGVQDVFVKDTLTGGVTRISTSAGGAQGNGASTWAAISSNGRRVAFNSDASNLVPGDTNATGDVFIKDLDTGATILASSGLGGTLANGGSNMGDLSGPDAPGISGNGNLVGFYSTATNLASPNTNGQTSIFVKDISSGTSNGAVTLEVLGSDGSIPNGPSFMPKLSSDGRYLAFRSEASNLLPGDTDTHSDIYFKDRQTGALTLMSTDPAGVKATYVDTVYGMTGSYDVTMSADGSHVAFATMSTELVYGTYAHPAINVINKDTRNGAVTLDSMNASDEIGNSWSFGPALSGDGARVVFQSAASNLGSGDTNRLYDIYVMNEAARPGLGLAVDIVYWGSFADYRDRILTVRYRIGNSGRIAYGTQITDSTANFGATRVSSVPVSLGDISTSYSSTGSVRYQVTPGIGYFTAHLSVTARDVSGSSYFFS